MPSSPPPSTYNITAARGETWDGAVVTIRVNNAPLNLASAVITWTVRNRSGEAVKTAYVGSGLTLIQPAAGVVGIDACVFDLRPNTYSHELTFAIGARIKRYVRGRVTITG